MKKYWLLLLLALLLAAATPPAEAAKGASSADNVTLYFKGGVITLDEPVIKIAKIYGLKLYPSKSPLKMHDKELYVNHVVENMSNTTAKVKLELVPSWLPRGWECKMIVDEKMDGQHESWENKEVPETIDMGEGAIYSFFVRFVRSSDTPIGASGVVAIKSSCVMKDGNEYTGNNGVTYGGEDEESCVDTVIVE